MPDAHAEGRRAKHGNIVRDTSVKPNGTSWFNSFGNPGTTTSTGEPAQQALSPEKS
jgi:hypothetical protein